jgi:hypothetical protein
MIGKKWRWIGRVGMTWLRKPEPTEGCKANGRRRGGGWWRRRIITRVCVRKGCLTEPASLLVIYGFRCEWYGFAIHKELRVYKTRTFYYSIRVLLFSIDWMFGPGSKDNKEYLERKALAIAERLPLCNQVLCQGFSRRLTSHWEIKYTTYTSLTSACPLYTRCCNSVPKNWSLSLH